MDPGEMLRLFEAHREAEAARDIDAILETFVADCFLETMPLGLRSEGRGAVRAAYELQFFTSFPDLAAEDEGMAFGNDVIVVWGTLREWHDVGEGHGECSPSWRNPEPVSTAGSAQGPPHDDDVVAESHAFVFRSQIRE
jgi:hypothetical protein